MKADQVEDFGGSLLQHGPASDRVYLMKLDPVDLPRILEHINRLVECNSYSKVFAKLPADHAELFLKNGYCCEARVPGFYNMQQDGLFLARFITHERSQDPDADVIEQVLQAAKARQTSQPVKKPLQNGLVCRLATPKDCDDMAELYCQVFASYPFPIHQPEYLLQTMQDSVCYAGIWDGNQLLALASAEMDRKAGHAEMTDFATRPDLQGQGFAQHLLDFLEQQMPRHGINIGYTIARATSFGMNITFSQMGYNFGGTLVRNTQISGGLESMNVWYRWLG